MKEGCAGVVILAIIGVLVVAGGVFLGLTWYDRAQHTIRFHAYALDSDTFVVQRVKLPFLNQWKKGYVYMYPRHAIRHEDGGWGARPTTYDEVKEGFRTFFGTIWGEENERLQYIILCSPEPLNSMDELEKVFWDPTRKTDFWFDPAEEGGLPRTFVLECR